MPATYMKMIKKILLFVAFILFASMFYVEAQFAEEPIPAESIEETQPKYIIEIDVELLLSTTEEYMPEYDDYVTIVDDITVNSFVFRKKNTVPFYFYDEDLVKDNSVIPYVALYNENREISRLYFTFKSTTAHHIDPNYPFYPSIQGINLLLPAYGNEKSIRIFFNNEEKYRIDIDKNSCNLDGICDEDEDYFYCVEDCPAGVYDGACVIEEEGVCDIDCLYEEDLECEQNPSLLCTNNELNPLSEESIDCGDICGICIYDDTLLEKLIISYDKHKLLLIELKYQLTLKYDMVSY